MSIAGPFPEGEGEVRWVTAGWLKEHLDDDMCIIDCQPNVHDFIRGHIPGAVYLAEESMRLSQNGMPHVWISPQHADQIFRTVGLNHDRPVLIYTRTDPNLPTGDGVPQGMMAYSLAKYGHMRILLLDGGLESWVRYSGKLETKYRHFEPGNFRAEANENLHIGYEEFLAIKDKGGVVHIDSRPPAQYQGRSSWPSKGHIPGAINVPWSEMFMTDNLTKLRPMDEIFEMLVAKGVTKDKEIICHCGSGRKAAAQLCVLKWFLGYTHIRLFEGSFTEWCAHDNRTVIGLDRE
jgi:thiosulfate/3-mercaptopyruvate sulfurtransferase